MKRTRRAALRMQDRFNAARRGVRASLANIIKQLFANGEDGVWYDPSDERTVFTDAAGTIPATVGDPVGYIADKSGNDNHAVQSTTASKPILREDAGGRRYLEFDRLDDKFPVPMTFTDTQPMCVAYGFVDNSENNIMLLSTNDAGLWCGAAKTGDGTNPEGGAAAFVKFWFSAATEANPATRNTLHAALDGESSVVLNCSGVSLWSSAAQLLVGSYASGTWYTHSHIYEYVFTKRHVTDDEGVALGKHLSKKAGVTL